MNPQDCKHGCCKTAFRICYHKYKCACHVSFEGYADSGAKRKQRMA